MLPIGLELTSLQEALLLGDLIRIESILKDELPETEGVDKIERCHRVINHLLNTKKNFNIPTSKYSTLLHFALYHQDNKSFQFLLKNSDFRINAPLTSSKITLLHVAAMFSTPEMVKTLIEYGANVNAKSASGYMPLHFACGNFQLGFYKGIFIIRGSSDPIPKDVEIVRVLLDHGSPIQEKLSYYINDFPIFLACRNNSVEIVDLLLKYGTEFYIRNEAGKSLLHQAVNKCNPRFVKYFLKKGMNPNVRDYEGQTPIYDIFYSDAEKDHESYLLVMELLIEYGADFNITDYNKDTPLHKICSLSHSREKMRAFLRYKPNPSACNKKGQVPLDLFIEKAKLSGYRDLLIKCHTFLEYLAMLKAGKKYVCERNLDLIRNDLQLKEIVENCEIEINKMKIEKISSLDNACYFDFLAANSRKLTALARNECIMKELSIVKYQDMFPKYADYLTDSINEANSRRNLSEKSSAFLIKFVEYLNLQLPLIIVDEIFEYLNEKDLRNFEKAFVKV